MKHCNTKQAVITFSTHTQRLVCIHCLLHVRVDLRHLLHALCYTSAGGPHLQELHVGLDPVSVQCSGRATSFFGGWGLPIT